MIKSFFKGVVIGIANIVPGVSGGTMMVSMGIYDDVIHAVTGFFAHWKKSVRVLFPLAACCIPCLCYGVLYFLFD